MVWQPAEKEYDIVVVGGGPAGLLAGYAAASRGLSLSVAVVEKMDRPGKKLLITGKGRCNVINNTDTGRFMANIRRGSRFMYSSINLFGSADVIDFFQSRGVPLVTERGNRVFPQSGKSLDIADVLIEAARSAGCVFINARVTGIVTKQQAVDGIMLDGRNFIKARAVIVSTGGLSYPKTGSTGDGYRFAQSTGHHVTAPVPSLVPLECADSVCGQLQGLSLRNVALTVKNDGKTVFNEQGEMLFTHFGISGPLVLSASAFLAGCGIKNTVAEIDIKPALDHETLDKRIVRDFGDNINREFQNSLDALLPKKLIPIIVAQSGIDPRKKVHFITVSERRALVDLLKAFGLRITRARPIAEAVITAGGIATKEIDPKTMMSKLVKNLHFAGEILDVDGFTGGFNLGIAFATGFAAGKYVLEVDD